VIVAVPSDSAVTSPVEETDTLAGALEVQVMARPARAAPLASRGVAVSCKDCPTISDPVEGVRVSDATGTGCTVTTAVPTTPSMVAVTLAVPGDTPLTTPVDVTVAMAALLVAQMQRDGGLISAQDLRDYRVAWREPLRFTWRGNVIHTAPLPSSGGVALVQLLGIKEARSSDFAGQELNSARYIHLLAEIEKRVFADRADYLGDPAFTSAPVEQLIAPAYLARRAAEVNAQAISPTAAVRPGLEPHQTTHFSILDGSGNAVSNTVTLNWDYGSGVVVEGAGFLMNDEMDDFSAKPGASNAFGVVGGDANAIESGKRMLSSMTPTIVTRDGQVTLVFGSPGGSRIFTTLFQVLNNLYDYGLSLAEAVAAQRVHHQLLPKDTIYFDSFAPLTGAVADTLKEMGYVLEDQGWEMGDVQAIRVTGTQFEVAADPRGRGVGIIVHGTTH